VIAGKNANDHTFIAEKGCICRADEQPARYAKHLLVTAIDIQSVA